MEIKPEEYKDYLNEDYLSVAEAAGMLEIGEDQMRALVKDRAIPAHTVAGAFLRFKKKEVEELKNKWRIERELFPKQQAGLPRESAARAGFGERLRDFWYFNDFYVLCLVLIGALLYAIVSYQ